MGVEGVNHENDAPVSERFAIWLVRTVPCILLFILSIIVELMKPILEILYEVGIEMLYFFLDFVKSSSLKFISYILRVIKDRISSQGFNLPNSFSGLANMFSP